MSWTKCYEGGLRHNFEPRYTQEPNNMVPQFTRMSGHVTPAEIAKMYTIERYLWDVCVWCGKISEHRSK